MLVFFVSFVSAALVVSCVFKQKRYHEDEGWRRLINFKGFLRVLRVAQRFVVVMFLKSKRINHEARRVEKVRSKKSLTFKGFSSCLRVAQRFVVIKIFKVKSELTTKGGEDKVKNSYSILKVFLRALRVAQRFVVD